MVGICRRSEGHQFDLPRVRPDTLGMLCSVVVMVVALVALVALVVTVVTVTVEMVVEVLVADGSHSRLQSTARARHTG